MNDREHREVWRWVIAGLGDFIAFMVMGTICLITAALSGIGGVSYWMWWAGGLALLILARRDLNNWKAKQ